MRTLVAVTMLFIVIGSQGCSRVEGTGRLQLMILSPEQENTMGLQAYQEVLKKEQVSNDATTTAVLRRVGQRIAQQANRPEFQWEFKLIESDTVNAFCLPGGKIAVYTGILPYMKNEAGMAAVLGHEVAHAVARHGGERVSQKLSVELAKQGASFALSDMPYRSKQLAMAGIGAGSEVGVLLPFSRKHESEADHLGIMYMAKAGYDPREAPDLWRRMNKSAKSRKAEFLSTHPHPGNRVKALEALLPEALAHYDAAPEQYGKGVNLKNSH
jgi:predicted Zn-dependent protease